MTARRTIYFLAHFLLIAIGSAVCLLGNGADQPWQTVWVSVGTSLIATGGAGLVIWLYLRRTEQGAARLDAFAKAGLAWIYPRRAAQIRSEYGTRLAAAQRQVDILGFGLSDFRRDYLAELGAISARARVRILLIDPDSSYANVRDGEEGQSAGTIASQSREFAQQFKTKYRLSTPQMSLRYYSCLPMVNIFRIDDDIFWGPYLLAAASGNTFTVRSERGWSFDQLADHFEQVWDNHSKDFAS